MTEKIKEKVAGVLGDFSGLDSAKALFAELNYDIARDSLSRQNWGKAALEALAEDPQIIATHGDFRIIYSRLARDRLLITPERAVVNTLLREHPYALFLFSNEDQRLWHFVNVKLAADHDDERNKDIKKRRLFRRITVREKEKRLWTAVGRISMLDLALIQPELFGPIPPLTIQSQHDTAFDVEAVTREFYDAYEGVFKTFWKDLEEQTRDRRWAHDYSLQFLNRLMFLYFVQRKGWLAEDSEFLETFWKTYDKSSQPKNTFFEKWLKVLFFEAFNNQKNLLNTNQRAYLPEEIRKALWEAPYLNGGLFKKNKLDEPAFDFQMSDRQFSRIFNLFQRYNFTITEDSPLDQEVAVDPEMIGKVYESLVNLTEAGMERSAAGIFYTPRTEIDLMGRLSLVDNLANHLGEEHKNLLYEAVFSLEQEDKEEADKALAEAGLWPEVEKRFNEITVLDPACGSGSFLVGMLYVLNDLLERAETQRGEHTSNYERRKQIIGQSLYGVDVMDWACHVAELRLWLALIVDAEFTKEQLAIRKEPLLPHFSFKIRCGDSLVQEVGGIDMAHRRGVIELNRRIKEKLRELKKEKRQFYSSDKTSKHTTEEALKSQEIIVFRELLQDRIHQLEKEAKDLMREQAVEAAGQQKSLLTGEWEEPSKQFALGRERREKQITSLKEEAKSLEVVFNGISNIAGVPFVWDIAFTEIFSGDSHGFDIVIGNPPYVRQEKIADPKLAQEEVTTGNKKEYKAKLIRSVYKEYPRFFGYKVATDTASHKISAKSDLYIYYYFHGLSLPN
ncbi:MAG: Eco57I restriction-modification methylase domain-containing protein, partial [Planctomycetota bacterium]